MMRAAIRAAVWAACLAACACGPVLPPSAPSLDLATRTGLAVTVALLGADGRPVCSGVRTDRGLLTAAHCVEPGGSAQVADLASGGWDDTGRASRIRGLRVIRVDADADLALLQTVPGPVVRVRPEPAAVGEPVVCVGHPAGLPFVAHPGAVSRPAGRWSGRSFLMTSCGTVGGMSGGPVLDAQGRLLGVTSFALGYFLAPVAHLGGAVPSYPDVLEFLR